MMTKIMHHTVWLSVSLGSLLRLKGGFAFKSKDFTNEGCTPVLRISNIKTGGIDLSNAAYVTKEIAEKSSNFLLKENNVVIAMSGATTGKFGVVKKENLPLLLNQRVGLFEVFDKSKLEEAFLKFIVQTNTFKNAININAIGGAQPNISGKQIESVQVLLPSIKEQQKIAAILTSVDEAIDKTEAIIKQTKKMKKGLMQELLTKGIGHTEFKETDIGMIPEEWEIVKMSGVIDLMGGQSSSVKEVNKIGKGTPYVTGPEQWDGNRIKENKWVEKPRKVAPENCFFITVKGSGTGTIFPGGNYAIARDIMAIIPTEKVEKSFLFYLTNFQAQKIVYNKVGMVPGISRGDILDYKVGLPTLSEQKNISTLLENVDRKINNEKDKLTTLKVIKKGLMQNLLTGKVRVKVDEPEVVSS